MPDTNYYYKENLQAFCESTRSADMSNHHRRFISYLEEKARILDLGCGAGRDLLAFKRMGYEVEGIDASPEMCKAASEYSGAKVRCMTFMDLTDKERYDGVWACASLLHASSDELPIILQKICEALKLGGIAYLSFKKGDFEGERNGRYFLDMDEKRFSFILSRETRFLPVTLWETGDVRTNRDVTWFNALLKKTRKQNE